MKSDDPVCELSELPTSQCACRIHGPKPEKPTDMHPRQAMFRGTCKACDYEIVPGDFVLRFDGAWAHVECV